jgi:hypothetical protein
MSKVDEKKSELKVKKKKIFKKNIKKVLSTIKKPFKGLVNKINKMNNTTKVILLVWIVIILLILFMALLVGLSKNNRTRYYEMEEKLYDATLNYVTNENVYPTKENKAYIPLESLIVGNYASKKVFTDNVDRDKDGNDDLCKGYSVVYYNGEEEQYSIESFVSCDKYTSKYYNDYLDYMEK